MAETSTIVTRDEVVEALKDVYDPEIPVNVVDLGLIYDVDVEDNDVEVKMTLTFAGCGMGPYIAQQAEWRIAELEAVEDVNVRDGLRPTLDSRYDHGGREEAARSGTETRLSSGSILMAMSRRTRR